MYNECMFWHPKHVINIYDIKAVFKCTITCEAVISENHEIRPNRESGFGIYDIMMIPKRNNLPVIVIEFKVYNPRREQTHENTVPAAVKQIGDKSYDTELMPRGIENDRIRHCGFAFEGKGADWDESFDRKR